MSNQSTEVLAVHGKTRKKLIGSFTPQGASNPNQPTGEASWVVITRTGAGTFRFTFVDKFVRLVGIPQFSVQLNSAVATLVVVTGATTVATTKIVDITVMQESAGTFAAADIAANANNRIGYEFTFADTTGTP